MITRMTFLLLLLSQWWSECRAFVVSRPPLQAKLLATLGEHDSTTLEVLGAAGRMGSLFLRQQGAIAIPRGVAPGCLSISAPIVAAIPSDSWSAVFHETTRPEDLVWVGNGLLNKEMHEGTTVVVPHFGILKVGADPVTSESSPPTYVYGKHAKTIGEILSAHGIKVELVSSWSDICVCAAQKVLWASCMWLLCHQSSDAPLTLSEASKSEHLENLVKELLPLLNTQTGGEASLKDTLSYMEAYSLSMPNAIPSIELARNELPDRNGIWLRMIQDVKARERSLHFKLLDNVVGKDSIDSVAIERTSLGSNNARYRQLVSLNDIDLVCTGSDTDRQSPKSVIVVGGGIMGSSIALSLMRRNPTVKVTVIDPSPIGRTTPASWAWLNANQKLPIPYKWLNQLGMRSWRLHPLLHDLSQWAGTLVCFAEPQELDAGYAMVGPISASELRELEPHANFRSSAGYVYHYPEEGYVDPRLAVERFRDEATKLGVTFVDNQKVERLIRNGEPEQGIGVETVATSGSERLPRTHCSDVVVVAAGVGCSNLTALELLPSPGRISFARPATTETPVLNKILVDMIHNSHLLQRKDGTLVAGGGQLQVGGTSSSTAAMSLQDDLVARATLLAPEPMHGAQYTNSEEAIRPMPLDGYPVVGYESPGFYVAVTHSGMTLSTILSQLVAVELLECIDMEILSSYRPTRFEC